MNYCDYSSVVSTVVISNPDSLPSLFPRMDST